MIAHFERKAAIGGYEAAALRAHTRCAEAAVDDLVDLADPYNGYVRHLPAVPFLPAVLAATGLPAVLHGRLAQGPKWGLTPHRVLAACGADTRLLATPIPQRLLAASSSPRSRACSRPAVSRVA